MENENKNKRSGHGKNLKVIFIITAVFILLTTVVIFGYSFFTEPGTLILGVFKKPAMIEDLTNPINKRTNVLILGTDKDGTRTDTIIVACYNSSFNKIDIVSIPRDTRVKMPEERMQTLTEMGRFVPKSGYMKINQVHHYAGAELGISFIVMQVEELLGIDIDYYVKVNTEAFRVLVDEIGGVYFDVPQRMIYDDPEQNLHINLEPGMQLLNGAQAEGLVRYRHGNYGSANETAAYPMADLDRVKIQQEFLKAFAQSLSQGNVVKNITAAATVAFKYVETDFSMADMTKYARYASDIDINNISTHTLPCSTKKVDGTDYAVTDDDELKEFAERIFLGIEPELIEINLEELEITVLNGAGISGLAAFNRDMLTDLGYNVVSIGDYYGVKTPYTRIFVKDNIDVSALLDLYPESKTEVDKNIEEIYNITIVLGAQDGNIN